MIKPYHIESPQDVQDAVTLIADLATRYDPELTHSAEDQLYVAVLEAIANGTCSDPQACAREALKSQAINFPRHFA